MNNTVFALALSGSDLYVGGGFGAANEGGTTVSANRVAKFNTTTGVWSAFGTGGGNSVTATLNFDGVSYNRLPAVLALSNVGSRASATTLC